MSTTSPPSIELELNGRTFALKYTKPALIAAKQKLSEQGLSVNLMTAFFDQIDFENLPFMIYAGIHEAAPGVTYEQVDKAVTLQNAHVLYATVVAAYVAALKVPTPDSPAVEPIVPKGPRSKKAE